MGINTAQNWLNMQQTFNNKKLYDTSLTLLPEKERKVYRIRKIVENSLNNGFDKILFQELQKNKKLIELEEEKVNWCFEDPFYDRWWNDFVGFLGFQKSCV